jgi:hypothetical protein
MEPSRPNSTWLAQINQQVSAAIARGFDGRVKLEGDDAETRALEKNLNLLIEAAQLGDPGRATLGHRAAAARPTLAMRDENLRAEPAAAPAAELGQPPPDPSKQAPRASRRDGAPSAARAPARRGGER